MVEGDKDKKGAKHGKPSNLNLERSLSITSQTSECRNADLSPGVPNNQHPPIFQHMLSVEQRNSLLKPSASSVHESACFNLSADVDKSCRSPEANEGVPMVDNIRNHKKNKESIVEMAGKLQLQGSDRHRSLGMPDVHTPSPKRLTYKFYLLVTIAFVVMLMLISGLLTGIFFTINQASLRSIMDDFQISGAAGEWCVPCGDLRLSSDPADDIRPEFSVHTPRGGPQKCCAHTDSQRQRIVELLVEKRLAQEKVRDMVPPPQPPQHQASHPDSGPGSGTQHPPGVSSTPTTTTQLPVLGNAHSAQVYLTSSNSVEVESDWDYRALRGWAKVYDTGFVKKGIDFDPVRGRFTISESGVYHLSLHLSYLSPETNPENIRIFGAVIARENVEFPWEGVEEVVSDKVSRKCDVRQHYRFIPCYTTSLEATVKLRYGDQLFVKTHKETTDLLEISHQNSKVSYFGLYQIDHS